MKTETRLLIEHVVGADATISPMERQSILLTLAGGRTSDETPDRLMSRAEVATFLGKSAKAVDLYGRRGIIRRIYLMPGGKHRRQSAGYSRNSVLDALKRFSPTSQS